MVGKGKYWLSGFLLLVVLTSSVYFILNDEVRIDIQKTRSIFQVNENGEWVVAGIEYVNLFDGSAKMRAKNRSLETVIGDNNITTVTRIANYKDGISTIEIYTFDPSSADVRLFPVSHEIRVINAIREDPNTPGYILQYEVQKLLYAGETVSNIKSPQSFGHQMTVEWDDGNYYSRIYKYKDSDEGKLTIKYRINSSDYSKNVRLFDPPSEGAFWYNGENVTSLNLELGTPVNLSANITGASNVCIDIDHPSYGYNYTCGNPANVTFNISWFRKTTFSDDTLSKTLDSTYTFFNGTTYDGGSYGTSVPKEWCGEYAITNSPSRLEIVYNVYSWDQWSDYWSDTVVNPEITIRDSDRVLLETIEDTDYGDGSGDESVISEDFYSAGTYGFCIKIPFALKPPVTNHTSVSLPTQTGYTKMKTLTMGWNYYANYTQSTVSSNNAFCTNKIKHVFYYKDASSDYEEYSLCIESGDYVFYPNQSKTLNYVEVWLQTGSGSAGLSEQNTTIMYLNQGGGFSVTNAQGTTYTITGSYLSKPPYIRTYAQNNSIFYISAHSFDEVVNFTMNLTALASAQGVNIYVDDVFVSENPFLFNTSEGNISETAETEFTLISPNSTTFSIPKDATVANTTINFTGGNITWEVGEYIIPLTWSSAYDPPSPALPTGTQSWLGEVSTAVDGNLYSGTGPWIDGPTYWDVEWLAYVYENYTKDSDAILGDWSSGYSCNDNSDITMDIDCWSGSSWVEIVSDSGTNCGSALVYKTFDVPSTCLAQSILQIKNTLQYGDLGHGTVQRTYYTEGKINYYRYGYPENLTMEVGIPDGVFEYQGSGELTGSAGANDFVSEVNAYLDTCTADANGFCDVPIYFTSADGGNLTIDNFEILYTYDPNPFTISSSILQDYLDNQAAGSVEIPIIVSMDEGSLTVDDIKFDYAGGNDTIIAFVRDYSSLSTNQLLDNFSDGSVPFNMSFETVTKYLNVPTGANSTSATINFTGHNSTKYCYQETANVSTACGCSADGTYYVPEGNWYNQANEYTYDGNWATGSHSYSGTVYGWVNYSKPVGAQETETYWQIKSGTGTVNLSLTSSCWSQSPLQVRFAGTTSSSTWSCYNGTDWHTLLSGVNREIYEEAFYWNITTPPANVTLEIGDVDGDYEWNESGVISSNITSDLSLYIDAIIDGGCSCDDCSVLSYGNICSIPFTFTSERVGDLEVHSLNNTYDVMGNLSKNATMSLINYYSKFVWSFPSIVDYFEIIPRRPTDQDVTPYGQTPINPIFNFTTQNYGGKDMNLSVYMNGSIDCVNLTFSTTKNKTDGVQLNSTDPYWEDFNTSAGFLTEVNSWMWADFACNYTSWYYFNPDIYFRGCCEDCICSEGLV